jgi:hypothetical protein
MDEFPFVDTKLVEALQRAFPDTIPNDIMTLSPREIGPLHGVQVVVRFLQAQAAEQANT